MTSAGEYLRQMQWEGVSMLHEHQLVGEDYWDEGRGARWVIGRPNTFVAKCEVIAGIGGSLIVHGDFTVVRFGHYGDHADAMSRLCWMGCCTDVGYYVAQKASIGMGRRGSVEVYDQEVAEHELLERIKEDEQEARDPEMLACLQEALDEHTESNEELRGFLSREGHRWDLWELSPGMVLDPHVIISHVALNKLASLLFEKYGDAGPPACLSPARRVA